MNIMTYIKKSNNEKSGFIWFLHRVLQIVVMSNDNSIKKKKLSRKNMHIILYK